MAAADSIDCEVIDLRTLRPLDDAAIEASVRKTNRVVLCLPRVALRRYGGRDLSDRIQRVMAFDDLDAPVARVCYEDINMPYAENLEKLALPSSGAGTLEAIREVSYYKV